MDRKEFTKRCLAGALIELLKDKEYNDISINDITTKSGFSRMSYYRNFDSIDAILDYYLDVSTSEYMVATHLKFDEMPLEAYMIHLFEFLGSEQCRFTASLLMKRGLFDRVSREFDKNFNIQKNKIRSYYYSFIAGGLFNAYKLWVINDYAEKPENIVRSFLEFTRYNKD